MPISDKSLNQYYRYNSLFLIYTPHIHICTVVVTLRAFITRHARVSCPITFNEFSCVSIRKLAYDRKHCWADGCARVPTAYLSPAQNVNFFINTSVRSTYLRYYKTSYLSYYTWKSLI